MHVSVSFRGVVIRVILFVLLAGYLPFHDPNLMEMYRRIGKAEFKCPNWFPYEARRLLSRILDPDPGARISIEKIKDNSWFKKGFDGGKLKKIESEVPETLVDNSSKSVALEGNEEEPKRLSNLNAFDIISLSPGFDLSGLFEDKDHKKETRFTSRQHATSIISKLEEIAKRLRLKVKKKDGGVLKMEAAKEGRKGVLAIDAEIFEVTPSFHMIEMKKANGDTLEYQKILKEDIRPALKDIVWAWQGEPQYLQHQLLQQQNPSQVPALPS